MNNPYKDLPYRPCAGIVLINKEGLIFAGHRIDALGGAHEAWQMPQGGIDQGEKPKHAAMRELAEEIGTNKAEIIAKTKGWITYDLPDNLLGKVWKGKYRGQKQKWFAMRFLGQNSDIDIETEHPEFHTWKWATREELIETVVTFKRDVYVQVLKEFEEYLQPS